jgi:hypothetical protein
VEELVAGGRVQSVNGPMPRLDALGAQRRIVLLAGADGAAGVTWRLLRPAARFSARLGRLPRADDRGDPGPVRLVFRVDDRVARTVELPPDGPAVPVELPLEGVGRLTVALEGEAGETAYLGAPELHPAAEVEARGGR